MIQIWNTNEVTLKNLQAYFTNAGFISNILPGRELWVRASNGLHFVFKLSSGMKLMRISTQLVIDKDRPKEAKFALVRRLNAKSAMPTFSLKDSDRLAASYVVDYQFGIIAEQINATFHLFVSLLESVARDHNDDGIINTWFLAGPSVGIKNGVRKILAQQALDAV